MLSYLGYNPFRWVIIFAPLWISASLSLLKDQTTPVTGLVFYWIIHFLLFFLFILAFFLLAPTLTVKVSRPRNTTNTGKVFDYLVIIRCLAFINVFVGHWFFIAFTPFPYPPPGEASRILESILFGSPWAGVWMFFTLSGYLISKGFSLERYPLSREGLLAYYRSRIFRIFPIYYASIFVWAVGYVHPATHPLSTFIDNSLSDLAFDDMDNCGHIISVLWSVSVEVQFYMVAPFMFLCLVKLFTNKVRGFAFCVTIILLFIFLKFEMYNSEAFVTKAYGLLLPNLDCFLCGTCIACLVRLWKQKQQTIRFGFYYGIAVLVLLQPAISLWGFQLSGPIRAYFLSIAPGITSLTIGIVIFLWEVAPESSRLTQSLFGRFTGFTAKLTYCLYVVHDPILIVARRLYPYPVSILQSACLLPLGLLVTFIVASALYFSIERPFDRWKS